jgi:hypothetical protein
LSLSTLPKESELIFWASFRNYLRTNSFLDFPLLDKSLE